MRGVTPKIIRSIRLSQTAHGALVAICQSKGGAARGATVSSEAERAILEYVRRETGKREDSLLTPALAELLDEKLGQVESWLRPMAAASAIHAAASLLVGIELLVASGVIRRDEDRTTLDIMRGRGYKLMRRKPPELEGSR